MVTTRRRGISVVLPVFNREMQVARAIDSVWRQDIDQMELIVVDDASTDNTPDVVKSFEDPRLSLLRHENNRGAAAARNTGIAAATGDLIAFIDSDDVWHNEKLGWQVELMERRPDVGLCCTDFFLVRRGRNAVHRSIGQSVVELPDIMFGCGLSPGTTLCARREVFNIVGRFDERLARLEDWEWLLRALSTHKLLVVREPLATVYFDCLPQLEHVASAVQILKERYQRAFASLGWQSRAKFRAALWHEVAVAKYREGRKIGAAFDFLVSLLNYPFRTPDSLYRLAKSVWRSEHR